MSESQLLHNAICCGLLLLLAVCPKAHALTINPTFDASITNDPQSAAIQETINAAITVYQNAFSDSIIVSIRFQEVTTGLGGSSTYTTAVSYSDYRAALVSHATTADDATALAHLPNGPTNPVNTNQNINLKRPLARALVFSADPPSGQPYGTISLNMSIINVSLTVNDSSNSREASRKQIPAMRAVNSLYVNNDLIGS